MVSTNMQLFTQVCEECSRNTTKRYSTSFASAIHLLHADLRQPIYNIYGFVRFDTFHVYNKPQLLADFKAQTYTAIEQGISLNPILNSFQKTVNEYQIDTDLINAFLYSMELDLSENKYTSFGYQQYIYGSAEVVGLMCLMVFCNGDKNMFQQLKPSAQRLGSAFQKVNFLRDLKADFEGLERMYFPNCDFSNFSETDKQQIEKDIQADFDAAYLGIIQLPLKARFGVYVAYKYYLSLFKKIKKLRPQHILQERIRIPDYGKFFILAKAGLRSQFNLL
jgi:15-cis-phytoene synthase